MRAAALSIEAPLAIDDGGGHGPEVLGLCGGRKASWLTGKGNSGIHP